MQPLAGDWRQKLVAKEEAKAAKKAKKAAKAAGASAATSTAAAPAAPAYPTNSKTKPDLAALSKGLPPGWRAMWDAASGDIYYGCPSTKVRCWHVPNAEPAPMQAKGRAN